LAQAADRAARLDQARREAEQRMGEVSADMQLLQSRLAEATGQAQTSQSRLEEMRAELARREQEARGVREQLGVVEQQQRKVAEEKRDLAAQLEATRAERRWAQEQLERERQEKEQLAGHVRLLATGVHRLVDETEGLRLDLEQKASVLELGIGQLSGRTGLVESNLVTLGQTSTRLREDLGDLARKSDALTGEVTLLRDDTVDLSREIRDFRPLTGPFLFNRFQENRVGVEFRSSRAALFGPRTGLRGTSSVLVRHKDGILVLFHAQETLLNVAYGQTVWQSLWGTVHGEESVEVSEVSFLRSDPRVAVLILKPADAARLGGQVFSLTEDPFRFDDAILVGGNGDYYGEAAFQVDPETPGYVRMERRRFSRLFGDFRPSRGDLVFSRSGELLGIMVSREFCHVLHRIEIMDRITLGAEVQDPANRAVLVNLGSRLAQLPARVQ
jgi:hypothetical protein